LIDEAQRYADNTYPYPGLTICAAGAQPWCTRRTVPITSPADWRDMYPVGRSAFYEGDDPVRPE
jgi:hypothetical protein